MTKKEILEEFFKTGWEMEGTNNLVIDKDDFFIFLAEIGVKIDEDLMPCPLCGSVDISLLDANPTAPYRIVCNGCGLELKSNDKFNLVAMWNDRITNKGIY